MINVRGEKFDSFVFFRKKNNLSGQLYSSNYYIRVFSIQLI